LRSLFVARTPSEEARSPGRRSNVENAPRHPPVSGQHRAQTPPMQQAVRTMSSYRGMDASLYIGFALCCHSNATRAPIANPPNSAQLGGSLFYAPSYIRVRAVVWAYGRAQTDRQTHRHTHTHTDARDHNTFCVVYDSTQNIIKSTGTKFYH